MSLFEMNRYGGAEKKGKVDDKKQLSDLLKRIEERKRQRAETSSETKQETESKKDIVITSESSSKDEPELSPPKKKEKKEETNDSTKNEITEDTSTDTTKAKPLDINKFLVLGGTKKKENVEARRVLPDWLSNPKIIPINLNSGPSLEKFDGVLDSKLIEVMKSRGIEKLFPVQSKILSWMLKCEKERRKGNVVKDTCVSAPTGSGKTLAYVLPIVQLMHSRLVTKIRTLIVVPTQELAVQVYKVVVAYTAHTNLRVGLLSGAASIQQERNMIIKQLDEGKYLSMVDIIVATPGRLVDHILTTKGFSLDSLKYIVIDEADKSDADWLQYLPRHHLDRPVTLQQLRRRKGPAQKLLFSATLSRDPEKLSRLGLFQPILFTSAVAPATDDDVNLDKQDLVDKYVSPEELTEIAVECPQDFRPLAVYEILRKNEFTKVLVFANSGETAHRLTLLLRSLLANTNLHVGELSSKLTPKQREFVLEKFTTGEIQVLVSSDALARGVDIPNVQAVISHDLPKNSKGYIHRAGRTGRAGKQGVSVWIYYPQQFAYFKHMVNKANKTMPDITKMELEELAETIGYTDHVERLRNNILEEKRIELHQARSSKRFAMKIQN